MARPVRKASVKVRRPVEPKPVKPVRKVAKAGLEVERVRPAMTKDCDGCEQRPEKRRLVVKKGGGRFGKTLVYCIECGVELLRERQGKLTALTFHLETGDALNPLEN